jgi:glycosyltransferase involved in cell wall biosynthesis
MRIAITNHQLDLMGGMESYLFNLIAGFNKQKDEVTVFVYKRNANPFELTCQVRIKNLSWLPRAVRKFLFASGSYKEGEIQDKDLKISLMRALNQDIVICGGTHLGYLVQTQKKPSLKDKVEIFYERKSYQTCTFIVAHSNLLKKELIDYYGMDPQKIFMCYPPIDNQQFNQALRDKREALRASFNFHPEKKIILFPSTGHKRKGFYALLEAFKQLPEKEYELIVVGNQPKIALCTNVKYLGFVLDMRSLYTACDLTILPSYYEPFGLVATESIACGTPVIISDRVGAKDLITEQEGAILEDLSPTTISAAIKNCMASQFLIKPDYIERMNLTVDAHINQLKTRFYSGSC